jgi:hypothetical protein
MDLRQTMRIKAERATRPLWRQLFVSTFAAFLFAPTAHAQSTAQKEGYAAGTNSTTSVSAPGKVKWVVSINNQQGDNATVTVTDNIPTGTSYVANSLQAPPGWTKSETSAGGIVSQVTAMGTGVGIANATQSAIVATVSTSFNASTGGDGWRPFIYAGKVYNLFHVNKGAQLMCFEIDTGNVCQGGFPVSVPPTAGQAFTTSALPASESYWTAGSFPELVSPAGKLYFFAAKSAGDIPMVICADLNTQTSCGSFIFSGIGAIKKNVPGVSVFNLDGGTNGTRLYANVWAASGSPLNAMACVETSGSSLAPCVGTLANGTFATNPPATVSAPTYENWASSLQIGTLVYSWMGNSRINCFDTSTNAQCTSFTMITPPTLSDNPAMIPTGNSTGSPDGFCILWARPANSVSKCYDLAGNDVSASKSAFRTYAQSKSAFWGYAGTDGGLYYKNRTLWISDDISSGSRWECWNWATNAACTGFPTAYFPNSNVYSGSYNTDRFYEATTSPDLPDCIWGLGDAGRLRSVDALTGGACKNSRPVIRAAVTPETFYCDGRPHPITWNQIRINGLIPNVDFTSAVVSARDQANNLLIPSSTITAISFPYSISIVPSAVTTLNVVVAVNLTPAGEAKLATSANTAQIVVSWNGDAPQVCFETNVSCLSPTEISNTANVAITANGTAANLTTAPKIMQVTKPAACLVPFELSKTIAGAAAGQQGPVTFAVTCGGTSYGPYTVPAGATGTTAVATIPNLPVGTQCSVTETTNGVIPGTGASSVSTSYTAETTGTTGNTIVTGPIAASGTVQPITLSAPVDLGAVLSPGGGKVKFLNTYPEAVGSLIVTKTIAGPAAGQQGAVNWTIDCGSNATVTLPANATGTTTVVNLPKVTAGAKCTVTETDAGTGALLSVATTVGINGAAATAANTATGTIVVNQTTTIAFTNTYDRLTGSLQIEKITTGAGAGSQAAMTFTAACGGRSYGPFNLPSGYTSTYPVAPVTAITGLPAGVTCTVTETNTGAATGQSVTTTVSVNGSAAATGTSASGVTIVGNGTQVVTFTNNYGSSSTGLVNGNSTASSSSCTALPVNVFAGATVTFTPTGGGAPITTTTNASGQFSATLPSGTYTMVVTPTIAGVASNIQTIVVPPGGVLQVNAELYGTQCAIPTQSNLGLAILAFLLLLTSGVFMRNRMS